MIGNYIGVLYYSPFSSKMVAFMGGFVLEPNFMGGFFYRKFLWVYFYGSLWVDWKARISITLWEERDFVQNRFIKVKNLS